MVTLQTIRKKALEILMRHPKGIRQKELFDLTKKELRITDEHSIKNALWNLPDKFPHYAVKQRKSARNVIIHPTDELLQLYEYAYSGRSDAENSMVKEAHTVYDQVAASYESEGTRLEAVNLIISNIISELEKSNIYRLLDLSKEDLASMPLYEIEAILRLKESIRILEENGDMLTELVNTN